RPRGGRARIRRTRRPAGGPACRARRPPNPPPRSRRSRRRRKAGTRQPYLHNERPVRFDPGPPCNRLVSPLVSDWLRWLLIALCLVVAFLVLLRGRRRRAGFPGVGWTRPRRAPRRRGMAVSVVGWLVVAVLVAGGAGGGLLWFLGWPQLPASRQFDVGQLLDLLKITLSVVAGFGGVVLLAVSYRKQRVAEDEHALAVQRAEREVVQKFNERFGSAAEQLANESPAVRLAGVYAMAGLADDWADKRQVCVDVLCGYLRISQERDGETEV